MGHAEVAGVDVEAEVVGGFGVGMAAHDIDVVSIARAVDHDLEAAGAGHAVAGAVDAGLRHRAGQGRR